MKSYKEPVSTASETSRFENIQFDINPFPFSHQRKLAGLRYQHRHSPKDM